QNHFGHRTGIGEGSIEHGNPPHHRRVKVNLVGTDAEASNGTQLGQISKQGGIKVGTRPDADQLCIAKLVAQHFGRQSRLVYREVVEARSLKNFAGACMDILKQNNTSHMPSKANGQKHIVTHRSEFVVHSPSATRDKFCYDKATMRLLLVRL